MSGLRRTKYTSTCSVEVISIRMSSELLGTGNLRKKKVNLDEAKKLMTGECEYTHKCECKSELKLWQDACLLCKYYIS